MSLADRLTLCVVTTDIAINPSSDDKMEKDSKLIKLKYINQRLRAKISMKMKNNHCRTITLVLVMILMTNFMVFLLISH